MQVADNVVHEARLGGLPLEPQAAKPLVVQQPATHMTVLEHAARSGATPDQLERMLELQVRADNHQLELMREKRRMDEEDRKAAAELAYRKAFAALTGENIIIPKSKFVDRGKGGSFWQAEYDAACDLLKPALSKHGFGFSHKPRFGVKPAPSAADPDCVVGWVWVTCYLRHKDGFSEELELEGPMDSQSANSPVQNMQSTSTFLMRKTLLAITGTPEGGADDEGSMKKQAAATTRAEDELNALRAEGRDIALDGMVKLTEWWGSISAKARNALSPDFPGFRRAAQAADKKGGAA